MMKDHEENSIPFEDSGIFPGKRKMLLKARNSKGREKAHLRRSSTDFQSEVNTLFLEQMVHQNERGGKAGWEKCAFFLFQSILLLCLIVFWICLLFRIGNPILEHKKKAAPNEWNSLFERKDEIFITLRPWRIPPPCRRCRPDYGLRTHYPPGLHTARICE